MQQLATVCLRLALLLPLAILFFFFNDTAPTEIYPLPLHDALPISAPPGGKSARRRPDRRGRIDPRPSLRGPSPRRRRSRETARPPERAARPRPDHRRGLRGHEGADPRRTLEAEQRAQSGEQGVERQEDDEDDDVRPFAPREHRREHENDERRERREIGPPGLAEPELREPRQHP